MENRNVDMVDGMNAESYPDVFNGELGELPGIQHLKLKPESQPSVMANLKSSLCFETKTEN